MKGLREKFRKHEGFTLVEMLIVVAIIAILVAVSIPVVNGALEKAKEATDNANLRAAKAVATIEYLNSVANGTPFTAITDVPYDADGGKLGTAGTTYDYGKKGNHDYIKVSVTATGDVTAEWNTDP